MHTDTIRLLLKTINKAYTGLELHSVEIFPDGSGTVNRGDTVLFRFETLDELDELAMFLEILRFEYNYTQQNIGDV